MKRVTGTLTLLALVAAATAAYAGSDAKCTADAQACLSHWSDYRAKGYIGLRYDKAENGTAVVNEVVAGSPAEKAGFQKGDVLVALNGASLADKEAMKKAKGKWAIGDKVTYTVKRAGAEKQLAVTLGTMPEGVFAQMLGEHMMKDHMATATASATSEQ